MTVTCTRKSCLDFKNFNHYSAGLILGPGFEQDSEPTGYGDPARGQARILNVTRTDEQALLTTTVREYSRMQIRQHQIIFFCILATICFTIYITHLNSCDVAQSVNLARRPVMSLGNFELMPDTRTPAYENGMKANNLLLSLLNKAVDESRSDQEYAAAETMSCVTRARGQPKGTLSDCLRPLINARPFVRLDYVPHQLCEKFEFCNGRGTCFLGKCFCAPGWNGTRCDENAESVLPCSVSKDQCFRHKSYGVARISLERWHRAQIAETMWWTSPNNTASSDDHANIAVENFELYRTVPDYLGHVLELGCGPFTQLKFLLRVPNRNWKVSSVTLADPILLLESKHPNSPFRSGTLEVDGKSYHTKLLQVANVLMNLRNQRPGNAS